MFNPLYFSVITLIGTTQSSTQISGSWRDFPLKVFTNATMVRPSCQEAFKRSLEMFSTGDIHALKMFDATAKVPSGVLNGNVVQYGDFNECMEVPDAQYCLVEMDLEPAWREPFLKHKDLVHSFYFFREKFGDPAHRVPGFTMVKWGFCLPRECSSTDLETSLKENFGINSHIRPGMCQTAITNTELTFGDYISRTFFAAIIIAVCLASFIDHFEFRRSEGVLMQVLMSFSLQRNLSKFLEKKSDEREIAGLHGIRALNTLGLLLSHKAISLFFNPFMNRTPTVMNLTTPWTIVGKNAIVYTDSFMLLSGLLNAKALLGNLRNGKSMKFMDKLINRVFRILPNFVAIILFCTYILPSLGAGPLWPTIITHHSHLCKQYMWRNFLFIHNYFGFENMCLTHTHQLGIDMQLFLTTPIYIYLISNHRRLGLMILLFISSVSTGLRFWVAYKNELSSVVYFGIPVSKMFETANLSYILPTHRATIYLMGVYLAQLLESSTNVHPNKIKRIFLWTLFLPMFLWSWFGQYHMVQRDFVYSRLEGSVINAVSPILWGAGVSFGIYAVQKNFAGWLGKLLCWEYFQYVTKLAYAIYLIQFPVFFYNVGITKHVDEYRPQHMLQIMETSAILLLSLALVLFVEMPFQNVRAILFDRRKFKKNSPVSLTRLRRKLTKLG